jgi:hypothetical protein
VKNIFGQYHHCLTCFWITPFAWRLVTQNEAPEASDFNTAVALRKRSLACLPCLPGVSPTNFHRTKQELPNTLANTLLSPKSPLSPKNKSIIEKSSHLYEIKYLGALYLLGRQGRQGDTKQYNHILKGFPEIALSPCCLPLWQLGRHIAHEVRVEVIDPFFPDAWQSNFHLSFAFCNAGWI